ncbi:hypothetical protein CHC07_06163 [Variovorax sp. B4]|nr:hypothetical protein CHC07_06163 [Variovorax sp. B4]
MAGQALLHAGGHDALLERIASGEVRATLAWEEADGRYVPAFVAVTARRSDDSDIWRLDGSKCAIRQGLSAHWFIVSARTSGAVNEEDGINLFLVAADAEGLAMSSLGTIDGGSVSSLELQNVQAIALTGGFDHWNAPSELACSHFALRASEPCMSHATPLSNFYRPESSSASLSAVSRLCSTAWRPYCSRSNRPTRRSSTRPRHSTATTASNGSALCRPPSSQWAVSGRWCRKRQSRPASRTRAEVNAW